MAEKILKSKTVAVVGTGPAGLMAADILSERGFNVIVFEKKTAPGKKLLIAGATGLNVTNACDETAFASSFGASKQRFEELFRVFSPEAWLKFIEGLGVKTFLGTSGRHFVEGLKAAPLLKAWIKRLKARGVEFRYSCELKDFIYAKDGRSLNLEFTGGETLKVAGACFCFGGASYEPKGTPSWAALLKNKKIQLTEFASSNAGFELPWPKAFLAEAEGKPIKNAALISSRGVTRGDLMVTNYGLEGTPVYHSGVVGPVALDLKPDLTEAAILQKLAAVKENLSPLRRAKKTLNLSDAALALLFHMTPREVLSDAASFARLIKKFPLHFEASRPLKEAISSSGGVSWEELAPDYMLKKFPGIFVAGEMIDWDAPTGGYLIQACASQGFVAAQGLVDFMNAAKPPKLPSKRGSKKTGVILTD